MVGVRGIEPRFSPYQRDVLTSLLYAIVEYRRITGTVLAAHFRILLDVFHCLFYTFSIMVIVVSIETLYPFAINHFP